MSILVGVGQAVVPWCDVRSAVAGAVRLVREAQQKGVKLLVLSELFLSGYNLEALKENLEAAVVDPEGEAMAPLRDACRTHHIAVVIGGVTERQGNYYNSAIAIDELGRVVSVYDKAHLWKYEAELFTPGESRKITHLAGINVGLAICYDAGFPEHARALALNGAELIACPTAFTEGGERSRYNIYWTSRALENAVYVLASNQNDRPAGDFFGESKVVGPDGKILAEAGEADGVVVSMFSTDAIARAREDVPYFADLRRDLGEGLIGTGSPAGGAS